MKPIKLNCSPDGNTATMSTGGASVELSALDIDALIHRLATVRAQMTPIHPAEPPDDAAQLHKSDNLLWTVRPVPNRAAIEFALQHPGLGWSAIWLSRAQAEDLQTSIEFALAKLPGTD